MAAEILLRGSTISAGEIFQAAAAYGADVRDEFWTTGSAPNRSVWRVLSRRGLSPHPALLLVLEGETEMLLMPRVLAELYGKPVPPALIDPVDMKSIDRDLDLLVRHVAGPKLGDDHGDFVLLTRPPTRVLVAVDPRGGSPRSEAAERARQTGPSPYESLPVSLRSTQHWQVGALVRGHRLGNGPVGVR